MKSIRVRMYRQGLGDCFLLTFPAEKRPVHVLIDCGVLKGTTGGAKTMAAVARNILDTTGRELDALVVTHEHWDHLSGFLQARDIFAELRVREVWLAWTEDRRDRRAGQLRNRKARALKGIVDAVHQLQGIQRFEAQDAVKRLSGMLEFHGGLAAAGQKTTHAAMEWVRTKIKDARIRYFRPGQDPFEIPGTGVRTYVLGPPRDVTLLKKSDPSKRDPEVYGLAAGPGADRGFYAALESRAGIADGLAPFESWFAVNHQEAASDPFFAEHYGPASKDWRNIEGDWLGAADRLALQLDSDTNNTSLALAFEFGKFRKVLLFPGDAQVGSWLSWEKLEWTFEEAGRTRKVRAADLLARTVLYKVGHHGSHNATLKQKGLELMTSEELVAMVPVDRATAKKMEWAMPFPSLFRRLKAKTKGRVLDLDRGLGGNQGTLTDEEWEQFTSRTDVQKLWIDYTVPSR